MRQQLHHHFHCLNYLLSPRLEPKGFFSRFSLFEMVLSFEEIKEKLERGEKELNLFCKVISY